MMRHRDGTDPNLRAEDGVTTPWSDAREPSGPAAGMTRCIFTRGPWLSPANRGDWRGSRAARRRALSASTWPGPVLADKAYSSRAIRAHPRRRGIKATIPEPADQVRHRLRRGS
jgi:hypothetical protein